MIITCPECATRYSADAAKFPPGGRKVKCAKCAHSWHQDPPPPEPVVEEEEQVMRPAQAPPEEEVPRVSAFAPEASFATPVSVSVEPAFEEPVGPSPWPGRLGVLAGWGLLALLVLIIGWALLHYRQQVASAWPQTTSFYAALGLPVNALGIDFENVSYRRERQDGQSVLAITGRLVNVSGREQSVPQIRAALSDTEGRELYHWTFSPGVATMRPEQAVNFLTRIASPPPGARHLEVRFVRAGE